MKEVWKPVVGYEGLYDVSSLGRIFSRAKIDASGHRRKGKFLKFGLSNDSYRIVTLSKNGRVKHRTVHSLVLIAFKGPRPEGRHGAHRNGRSLDNRLSNLKWATPVENMADRDLHGTSLRGERNHKATKLTTEKVQIMRQRKATGEPLSAIAKDFDVSYCYASRVIRARAWSHV